MIELPILRGSERRDFKRCPQRWYWSWRLGLQPVKGKTGALWFGTLVHVALQHHYIPGTKRGIDPRETWEKLVKERIAEIKDEVRRGESVEGDIEAAEKDLDLGISVFDNYLATYGSDDEWEVLAPEQTFSVLLPRPGGGEPIVRFVGTFDLVAIHLPTGKLWLWDHKTAKSIQVSHLPLDDQAGGYFAVAPQVLAHQGIVPKGTALDGIMYNFIMKSPADPRPQNAEGLYTNKPVKKHYVAALAEFYRRTEGEQVGNAFEQVSAKTKLEELKADAERFGVPVLGDVSEKQPAKRLHREPVDRTRKEVRSQIERIASEAVVMGMYRDGSLPIIKNPTKDCQWDCDFRQMCELDERGADIEEYMDVVYKQEDPYADHRRPGEVA